RLSKWITRKALPSISIQRAYGGYSHRISTWESQPSDHRRSMGPPPETWYAIWTPSWVIAYSVLGLSTALSSTVAARRCNWVDRSASPCRSGKRRSSIEPANGEAADQVSGAVLA